MTKSIFASRTIWFNVLTLTGAALATFSANEIISDNPAAAGGIAVAASVVNLLLRIATSKPIA